MELLGHGALPTERVDVARRRSSKAGLTSGEDRSSNYNAGENDRTAFLGRVGDGGVLAFYEKSKHNLFNKIIKSNYSVLSNIFEQNVSNEELRTNIKVREKYH